MLNLNSVMIGTKQPDVLAAFYEKVLGKPADMVDSRERLSWLAGGKQLFRGADAFRDGRKNERPGQGDDQF